MQRLNKHFLVQVVLHVSHVAFIVIPHPSLSTVYFFEKVTMQVLNTKC